MKGPCSWNKMWSLKGLAMLKCEIKTSLYAVQCKWQPGSVLMFCSYYFKNCQPRHFVFMFCGTTIVALFLACSWIICQNQGFCWCKIVLIKKSVYFYRRLAVIRSFRVTVHFSDVKICNYPLLPAYCEVGSAYFRRPVTMN